MGMNRCLLSSFLIAFSFLLSHLAVAQSTNTRALVPGEVLLNVYMMGADKTNIVEIGQKLADKILVKRSRFETGSVSFISKTETLFQYILTAGTDPSARKIAEDVGKLTKDEVRAMGIDRPPTEFATTPAPPPPEAESSTMRTVLIVGGAGLSGALLALIVASLFCKPRSTEAEERRQKATQEETRAKIEAEMQVQQLVRSAAFQRLQERVIGLEKEEQVRKAVNEVEDNTKKNRGIAKQVARELLDEPFVEPRAKEEERKSSMAARLGLEDPDEKKNQMSEEEYRKQRAADMVENAPWWHNSALQAEITADLAMPRYAGLKMFDDEDDDEEISLGASRSAASKNLARAERTKKKSQTAKIPDQLIDYSAITLIAQGHHWLSHTELPKLPPKIEPLVMLAKSNLHGVGVFARRFIDRGTLLFPYANPSQVNTSKHIYTAAEMRFHFGTNWDSRMHFVARDGNNKKFCVAEAPRERGWGCVINSARGTGNMMVANCECYFPENKQAGIIPWIRVTQTIAPLGELLLDYPFPELIAQQRGLDPDALDDEPPPVAFSTYGASLKVPLLSGAAAAAASSAAPAPRQSVANSSAATTSLPAPPPPPPMSHRSVSETAAGGSGPAVSGLMDLPPPSTPGSEAPTDRDELLPPVRIGTGDSPSAKSPDL